MPGQLQACSVGFPLVFLGVTGFVASIIALLLAWTARTPVVKIVTLATFALGAFTIAAGAAATARDLATLERALETPGLLAENVARLRAQGGREARTCTMIGVQSGTMPLFAGAAATIVALVRSRRKAAPT